MTKILGAFIVLAAVLGGYTLASGHLLALWQPFEILIIVGAAIGAFLIANPMKVTIAAMKMVPRVLAGPSHSKRHYLELLSLLYSLFAKVRREGLIAVERDIEDPKASHVFRQHPNVARNWEAVEFITDYLRLVIIGDMSAYDLDNLMEAEIDTMMRAKLAPAQALYRMADALPGFGIVAAVLGIVISMQAMGEAPEVLGAHIAAALVGTLIGILLAYGFVGPFAISCEHHVKYEMKYFDCIRAALVASVNGVPPKVAVEFGRKILFAESRPSFTDLEKRMRR